ncbi:hypothetical protein ACOMHN_027150 [Nucella lapillus]
MRRLCTTMKRNSFCLILLIIVQMSMLCSCQEKVNETYLIREIIMKNYDPLMRPVQNFSQAISLNISIGMKAFIELDMKKQTLTSFGWLSVSWYDQFLSWDVNQYPFPLLYLKADMVWHPDLVIFNTVSDLDQLEKQKRKVIIEHTGKVNWIPGGLFQTFCSVNIFRYPLDTQTCTVQVAAWSYTLGILNAQFMDPAFETDQRIEHHPEWTLVSKKAERKILFYNWQMHFSFTLKRKPMFYILNMILPIPLLSLLNCLVFLLPVESGEKMTVSVTAFLSFAVFLSVINNSLPQNSDSVCLFSVYVAVQMFFSVCFIIMAACIVYIHKQDIDNDSRPTSQCQSSNVCRKISGMNLKAKKRSESVREEHLDNSATIKINPIPLTSESSQSSHSADADCAPENEDSEACVCSQDRRGGGASMKRIWLMVTNIRHLRHPERRLLSHQLDRMCLKFSLVINVMVCIVFVCIWTWA